MEALSLHDTEKSTRLKETSSTKFEKTALQLTSAIKGVKSADTDSKHIFNSDHSIMEVKKMFI